MYDALLTFFACMCGLHVYMEAEIDTMHFPPLPPSPPVLAQKDLELGIMVKPASPQARLFQG